MARKRDSIRIGISGWRYKPWRKTFYPHGLAQHRELHYASRVVPTIEINGSFYSLQRPTSWARWYADTPEDFVFSVKGPRYITHILRLRDFEKPLANFFASGIFNLKQKLGPVLWQFPASFRFDPKRFESFLGALPRDTDEALRLARGRGARMKGRSVLKIDENRRLPYAVEVRSETFVTPAFIAMLRRHRVAFVIADTAKRWPEYEDITADFVYVRLHGAVELYKSGYSGKALNHWTARLRQWSSGRQPGDARLISDRPPRARTARDVFCYFDNTDKVKAPNNAKCALAKLGLAPRDEPQQ